MAKYKKRPIIVEAITFDELAAYGRELGAPSIDGLPGDFIYQGQTIRQAGGNFIIPTLEGIMLMGKTDLLVTGSAGEIYPVKADIFAATYDPVGEQEDLPAPEPEPKPEPTLEPAPEPEPKAKRRRKKSVDSETE